MDLLTWICDAVHRQGDGPLMVPRMMKAYEVARDHANAMGGYFKPTAHIILEIAAEVHGLNVNGFRQQKIKIRNGDILPVCDFERALNLLADAWDEGEILDDEWYYRFQQLHPFLDGNGRTGQIVWHFLDPIRLGFERPPRYNDLAAEYGGVIGV